ncbi:replicative DNA helicase [Cerasicoccus arenae]|uniref:Replicative DNA helicase n=1 Tax=Cerasicoccus arenae TaxID=424488 RepID=A0A8J3GF26_9BACT|nr:replicative DNA helicase [Cerasicoccus arenae]MBK1859842.1 replicative DNA helicase [Cerasicoccus arenae]GHC08322.1 replicative DNA helicase [Cerasicoccus arenae]
MADTQYKQRPFQKKKNDLEPYAGDRLIPHDLRLEQALLGCILLEGGSDTMAQCIQEKVRTECFYSAKHQMIFDAMTALYKESTPIDELILRDELNRTQKFEEIGGDAYLFEITGQISTTAHMPHYIERIKEYHLLRELIRFSNRTVEGVYENPGDVTAFIEEVEQSIYKISEDRISDSAQKIDKTVDGAMRLIYQMYENRGEITGTTTGFVDLDKMTTGWHPAEMIVVAARPSMGKTSMALNMVEGAIMPRTGTAAPTLMFSLEMPAEQLAVRLLCSRARVNMSKLREGFLPQEKQKDLVRAAQEVKAAPFFIDDSSGLTILEIRAKARRLSNQMPLGLVVVDYLQLVAGDNSIPREQQIADISRGMKGMAKELGIPVIVLAQLNRESEKEKRQPRMSDLRESGSIEQDADVVLLISKPREFDEQEDLASDAVARDLIIAKQRNGPVGTVPLMFTKNLTRFENYTPQPA